MLPELLEANAPTALVLTLSSTPLHTIAIDAPKRRFNRVKEDSNMTLLDNRQVSNGHGTRNQNGSSFELAPSHGANSHDNSLLTELEALGLLNIRSTHYNLSVPEAVEQALARGEGRLSADGALVVETGQYTGRSPHDRFIVEEPETCDEIDWNERNVPISSNKFRQLLQKVRAYVQGRDLFVCDGYIGADPAYRFGIRVITEFASHHLFARHLFLRPDAADRRSPKADFTIVAVPGLQGDPEEDGIRSEAFIVLHLTRRLVIIGGTRYAGEIKKSAFTLMNFAMPARGVLPMHGAANIDRHGHSALFFGLSGTGKTSLSADPQRYLIGDDEHGWSEDGVFNFEGGCYAKTIRLDPMKEAQIWSAIRFGTLLENVILDPDTRQPDYDNSHLTENTRAAYPLRYVPNCAPAGVCSHPNTLILLTADAFGVLPPIAQLTREQAAYHFLSGYTSKLAGTERGITAPEATFSACFGQVFFPRSPATYADLLTRRLQQHPTTRVFLVNTGWTSGPYGIGHRIDITHTRAMVNAALSGKLDGVPLHPHPRFNVLVPESIPGISDNLLDPQRAWEDPAAYDERARALARHFAENFAQFDRVSPAIATAGPRLD
ncbi:MAG: phosphoenolpyruvate carboxykinase (ATP) [Cyanobacteria bacterium P01_F01_bin.33]